MTHLTHPREKEFHYSAVTTSSSDVSMLSGIRVGAAAGDGQNSQSFDISPAVLAGLDSGSANEPLTGSVQIDILDLQGLGPDGSVTTTGGIAGTQFSFDIRGHLTERIESFDNQPLAQTTFTHDAIGSVKSIHDSATDRTTTLRYDYEIPVGLTTPQGHLYEATDYLGNVTHVATDATVTRNEYETDDTAEDAVGRLLKTAVAFGDEEYRVEMYAWANDGRLLRTQRPDGYLDVWTYHDNFGLPLSHTDANGLTTNFLTYHNGQVSAQEVVDAYGDAPTTIRTDINHDDQGFPDLVTRTSGSDVIGVQDFDFDHLGDLRRHQLRGHDGNLLLDEKYEYAADGRLIKTTDADGVISEITIDRSGLVTQTIDAVDQSFTAASNGQPHSIEQKTAFTYYADGSPRQTTHAGGSTEQSLRDPAARTSGTILTGVAGDRWITRQSFDTAGRLTLSENLTTGAATRLEYNDPRHDSPTDRYNQSHVASVTVGTEGAPTASLSAVHTDKFVHDGFGNVLFHTHPGTALAGTSFGYDTAGRVDRSEVLAAQGAVTTFTYTTAGLPETQTETRKSDDASQLLQTRFEYDNQRRLRLTDDPLSGSEPGTQHATINYSYDAGMLKVESTDRTGVTSTRWLDAAGNLAKTQSPFGAETTHHRGPTGKLAWVDFLPALADDTIRASRTTFEQDALGRVRSQTLTDTAPAAGGTPLSLTTHTDYFLPGDTPDDWTTASTDAGGNVTATLLDALGQPTLILQPAVGVRDDRTDRHPVTRIERQFDPATGLQTITQTTAAGTGSVTDALQTSTGGSDTRTRRQVVNPSGQTLLSQQQIGTGWMTDSFSLDPAGRPVQSRRLGEAGGDIVTTMTYDDAIPGTGLLSSSIVTGNPAANRFETFDSAGNRLSVTDHLDASHATFIQRWTHDALSRPLTHSELVNQTDTNGSPTDVLITPTRTWTYQGPSTTYTDRTGQSVITTRDFTGNPTVTETTTGPATGMFTATTYLNSDGSVRRAEQTIGGLPSGSPLQPSTSIVAMAYDAAGRQMRDVQDFSLGSEAGPQLAMEYSHHAAGPLEKIVRKVAGDRVRQTTFGTDAAGNVTSILDQIHSDAAATGHWVDLPTERHRFIDITRNIDGGIDTLSRHAGSDADAPDRGFSKFGYRADGLAISLDHEQQNGDDHGSYLPLSEHSRTFRPDGQINQDRTIAYDEALIEFLDDTYDYQYTGGRRSGVSITGHSGSQSHDIQLNAVGVDVAGSQTSIGPRVHEKPLDNGTITYRHDGEGRVIESIEHTTDTSGSLPSTTTRTTTHQYDHRGRLIVTKVDYLRQHEETTYSGSGNIASSTTITDEEWSGTTAFYYDALNRQVARRDVHKHPDGTVFYDKLTRTAHDATGEAFELVMTSSGSHIERNYLQGPTGVLAVDQTDGNWQDAGHHVTTAWVFTGLDGSASVTAAVDASGNWHRSLHHFGRHGQVLDSQVSTSMPLLASVPTYFGGQSTDPLSKTDRIAALYQGTGSTTFGDHLGQLFTPNQRILGGAQAVGGLAETIVGVSLGWTGFGVLLAGRGLDDLQAGLRSAWSGEYTQSYTSKWAEASARGVGASDEVAARIGSGVEIVSRLVSPAAAGALGRTVSRLNPDVRVVARSSGRQIVQRTGQLSTRVRSAVSRFDVGPNRLASLNEAGTGVARLDMLATNSQQYARFRTALEARGVQVIQDAAQISGGAMAQSAKTSDGVVQLFIDPTKTRYVDVLHEWRHIRQFQQASTTLQAVPGQYGKYLGRGLEAGALNYEYRLAKILAQREGKTLSRVYELNTIDQARYLQKSYEGKLRSPTFRQYDAQFPFK